jgi:hypothetical protein
MKHQGGCHCGKVRYEVDMDLKTAVLCNCSICMKRGSLLDFVPVANFKVVSGESNLQSYKFNKNVIDHQFCKTCGILPFAKGVSPDGSKMIAVNLRSLDNVDLSTLQMHEYNGRDL